MLTLFFYAIGFLVFLFIVTYGMYVNAILKLRLKRIKAEPGVIEDIPLYLKEVFIPYESELNHLGFEFYFPLIVDSLFANQITKKWIMVYVNQSEKSFATLSLSDLPEPVHSCDIEFITCFSDHCSLNTLNGISHRIIGSIPNAILQDPYTESLISQWDMHQKTLIQLLKEKIPVTLKPSEFIAKYEDMINRYVASLEAQGWIKKEEDGNYALRLVPSLRTAFKMMTGENKLQELRKKRMRRDAGHQNMRHLPIEVEVEAYQRLSQDSKRPGLRGTGKLLILFVTLILFGISFGLYLSFKTLFIIIAVISFHELGHFFGMHIFQYKDVKVFFLPFLGAATIGSEKNAKPFQKVIVYLLGPVPGIILGLTLAFYYGIQNPLIKEMVTWLLVVNYLNLLPIMPLDGGHLFNLFFSRFPILQFGFQILCGFLLILGSIALHNDPILFILGIFLMVSAFTQGTNLRMLFKIRHRIKKEKLEPTEAVILPEILKLLQRKPFQEMPFARKYQTIKYLVDNASISFPSIRLVLGTFLIYLFIYLLPVSLVFGRIYLNRHHESGFEKNDFTIQDILVRQQNILTPNHDISLSLREKEIAGQIGFDQGVLLLVKQLSRSEIKPLSDIDEEYQPVKVRGFFTTAKKEITEDLALSLRQALKPFGYQVFIIKRDFGSESDKMAILQTTDQYEILRIQKTDGINYGITNERLITQLKDWYKKYPFQIIGADMDWVEIEFNELPQDLDSFVKEVQQFCPDSMGEEMCGFNSIKKELFFRKRLFLWWD